MDKRSIQQMGPEDLEIIVGLAEALAEANGRQKLYIHELDEAEKQYMKAYESQGVWTLDGSHGGSGE
jgi:hypothetical protein